MHVNQLVFRWHNHSNRPYNVTAVSMVQKKSWQTLVTTLGDHYLSSSKVVKYVSSSIVVKYVFFLFIFTQEKVPQRTEPKLT